MASKELAAQIIEAVGGEENVKTLGHCMTRLRFTLKDPSKANDDAAKKVKGVKGLSKAAGQYQMIIGTGVVDDYLDTIMKNYTFARATYDDAEEGLELLEGRQSSPPAASSAQRWASSPAVSPPGLAASWVL